MKTELYEEDRYIVLKAYGKLDTIHSPEFTKTLQEVLQKRSPLFLLDLSEVSFLSSSGLQALLIGAKTSKQNNTEFVVVGMNEMLNDVFEMSGFNNFIKSFNSQKEALESL